MKQLHLVIGGAGHLGNNLTRSLIQRGERVRAGVRNVDYREPFEGLDCEIVYADIMKKDTLLRAMDGVDILYIAAAVYKSWAIDIQKEIIDVNVEGTRNIMEAAAAKKVKKIAYVSTTFALDKNKTPMDETGWSDDRTDPYVYSKTEAERLATVLAKEHNQWMVSIVPSGMIGPNCWGHLTPTMELLSEILKNRIPFDPGFSFNFVDIRDVCRMMIEAAQKGKDGSRYIVAQENPIGSGELFALAHSLYLSVKVPPKAPYLLMYLSASVMELASRFTKKKPLMQRNQVKSFRGADLRYTISKAREELGFNPRPTVEVLTDAFEYLKRADR